VRKKLRLRASLMKTNPPQCENRRATKAEVTRGHPHSQCASPHGSGSLP
jgi:hypothetical protein